MSITITIDELSDAIDDILTVYAEEKTEEVKKQTERSMKELMELTKSTAPVGHNTGKHYKDYIACRVLSESAYEKIMQWYVKPPYYSLTHLLNNGHQLRNGGRWGGTAFLSDAVQKIEIDFVKKIEEIYNG